MCDPRTDLNLPTLQFDANELAALLLGARMVRAWGGTQMGREAAGALAKIESVLPEQIRRDAGGVLLFAPDFTLEKRLRNLLDGLNLACHDRRVLQMLYQREDGAQSEHTVHPLGLYFWGGKWTLVAWCGLRSDFRHFRLGRIQAAHVLKDTFEPERGGTLQDFLRSLRKGGTPQRLT